MRADAVAKRASLITAGRALISEQGIDVPLSAVAAHAGVGIATLYRHFPTRSDLVLGILMAVREEVDEIIDRAEQQWDSGPDAAWEGFAREMAQLRLGTLGAQLGPSLVEDELRDTIIAIRDDATGHVGRLLSRAQAAGLVAHDVTVARFQIGMAKLTRALRPTGFVSDTDELPWLVTVWLRGLRPEQPA